MKNQVETAANQPVVINDHMKFVAMRHAGKDRASFEKTLREFGWQPPEIEVMWAYKERSKNNV